MWKRSKYSFHDFSEKHTPSDTLRYCMWFNNANELICCKISSVFIAIGLTPGSTCSVTACWVYLHIFSWNTFSRGVCLNGCVINYMDKLQPWSSKPMTIKWENTKANYLSIFLAHCFNNLLLYFLNFDWLSEMMQKLF